MSNYGDLFIFALVLTLWIVLNRWVLPWFGVSTCMGGGCTVERRSTVAAPSGWQQELEREADKAGWPEGEHTYLTTETNARESGNEH
jgi:hypothetical protein